MGAAGAATCPRRAPALRARMGDTRYDNSQSAVGGAKTKKQEANNGERSFQEKRDLPAIYTGHERTHTKNYSMENKKGTRLKVNKRE